MRAKILLLLLFNDDKNNVSKFIEGLNFKCQRNTLACFRSLNEGSQIFEGRVNFLRKSCVFSDFPSKVKTRVNQAANVNQNVN